MDLRQLAALTAVADHASFTAAARALHTVQSNVSTHILHLEQELGAKLIDRASGQLTDAGLLVVARARRVQTELESLVADVESTLREVTGTVRLGVIGTTGRWLVPDLLIDLAETQPNVRLVLVDATTTSLVPQLVAGTLDLAVVNLPVNDPDVDAEVLFEEDHVVVIPAGHRLGGRDVLSIADLADVPLLLEPSGTGFRDDLDADAQRVDVTLTPQAEVDGMRLLATLAYGGVGAAILPASAIAGPSDGTWQRAELVGATPRTVGLATSRRARLAAPARATVEIVHRIVNRRVPTRDGLELPAAASGATELDGPVPSSETAYPEDHR